MSAEERVQRGVDLLDRAYPGWRDEISVGELDLTSQTKCVLGQLYGHVTVGLVRINQGWDSGTLYGCGFVESDGETAVWVDRIHPRVPVPV